MEEKNIKITKLHGIEYAADTNVGMRREENQDSYGVIEKEQLQFFMVADGMGGVKGGGIASKLAIEAITNKLANRDTLDDAAIASAVELANRQIFEKGRSDLELVGMGTTFVGLAFVADQLYVVNVGDSRAYHIRQNEIVQLTDDHTLVMELVKSGALSIEQAQSSPCSHMLTRSLGPGHEVLVDCSIVNNPPVQGDYYMLCTDGLYNLVSDEEIHTIICEYSVKEAVDKLINLANQRGGSDNITVVVIKVGSQYVRSKPEILPVVQTMGRRARSASLEIGHTAKEGGSDSQAASEEKKKKEEERPIIEPRVSIDQLVQAQEEALAKANQLEEALKRMTDAEELRQQVEADGLSNFLSRPISPRVSIAVIFLMFLSIIGMSSYAMLRDKGLVGREATIESSPNQTTPPILIPEDGIDYANDQSSDGSKKGDETILLNLSDLATFQDLSAPEKQSVIKRTEGLRALKSRLEQRLKAVSQGSSANAEAKRAIEDRVAAYQQELSVVHARLETATRKLAIWYGRRNRLKSTNPLNLANEIAVSSRVVREHKSEFESVTYEYLKNAEELKYDPTNEELQTKIADLVIERRQRLEQLSAAITEAVDEIISDVNRNIAELTLQRERVQSDLLDGLDELRYEQIQAESDPESTLQLKSELEMKLKNTLAEINELESILIEDSK